MGRQWKPTEMLDYGSGLGTAVWAAWTHWNDMAFTCVDPSQHMLNMADALNTFDSWTGPGERVIRDIAYRRSAPILSKPRFDISVAAFTLSELNDQKSRLTALNELFYLTKGVVVSDSFFAGRDSDDPMLNAHGICTISLSFKVLVEHGNDAGFQLILEARKALLRIAGTCLSETTDTGRGVMKKKKEKGVKYST